MLSGCREADVWMVEPTYTEPSTHIHTHTNTHPGPSLHSQSQIRWQIRRLILLGGRGIGVPPLLRTVPLDTCTQLTHTSLWGWRMHTHTRKHALSSHRCLKIPPPIQVSAFSFTPLYLSPILPLSPPASLCLPSAASRPIRREVTSLCCSQCGGRTMSVCVCVMGKKGKDTHIHAHTDTPGILTGLLCVPARPANLNSSPLTTHTLQPLTHILRFLLLSCTTS